MANIYEQAGELPAREAEKFCGAHGIDYHPLVCDRVTQRDNADPRVKRCEHVGSARREQAEAGYAKFLAKLAEAAAVES